jgi:hypothetical protein
MPFPVTGDGGKDRALTSSMHYRLDGKRIDQRGPNACGEMRQIAPETTG